MKQIITTTAPPASAGLHAVRVNVEGHRPSPGDIDRVQSMYRDAGEPTDVPITANPIPLSLSIDSAIGSASRG